MIEIEVILTIISLLGMACVSRHETRFIGFFICLLGNIGWLIVGFMTAYLPFLLLFGGYFIFNAIGMHDEYGTWRKMRELKGKYRKV